MNLLLDEGLRTDGRRPNELRKIECKLGVSTGADGSAFVQHGQSIVLVSVYGPHAITNTKMKISSDKAIINCEFRTAPFSGNTRSKSSFGDRKSVEITNVLRQAFEAAILTNLYPGSQIDIFFLVLYSDGGISSICINAGTLAVINAGIPMKDYLCACSSGFVNEIPLTDINHIEGFTGNTEFTLAMLIKSGAIVSEELNARIHRDHMNKLKQSAIQGCKDIYEILDAAVRKHAALNQSC